MPRRARLKGYQRQPRGGGGAASGVSTAAAGSTRPAAPRPPPPAGAQCIDINLFSWFIDTVAPTKTHHSDIEEVPISPPLPLTHLPSLPLSAMAPGAFDSNWVFSSSQPLNAPPPPPPHDTPPPTALRGPTFPHPPPPTPSPWTPQFDPESWIYTDGSLIDMESRLGDAVIHSPSTTTLHIDASGIAETHTIMRAELVAIYVALDRFRYLKDFRLFTDSLSNLQAIQKCLYRLDPSAYHHTTKPFSTTLWRSFWKETPPASLP